jgi:hypothetical protein
MLLHRTAMHRTDQLSQLELRRSSEVRQLEQQVKHMVRSFPGWLAGVLLRRV